MNLKIPMPPPEVQEEIVEELDNVQESAKLSEALVGRLQRQMKMITRIIKGDLATLEEVCKAENGKVLTDKTEGEYNVMSGGTRYNRTFVKYNREPYTFTISKSGTAGYVKWHTERFWAGDCFTLTGDPERVVDKYLYYYLKLNNHLITEKNTCSTIPHCKWEDIKGIMIPIPSIDAQNVIIDKLEVLDHQIKTLTSSGNSFILDSFLGSSQ
jgi:type I restriction enzyme S subunit